MSKKYADLPPKSCTIEQLVTIPDDINKVIAGEKQTTRRNGRYADIGEVMSLDGQEFIVTDVYASQLKDMTDQDAKKEGYKDLATYQSFILSLHPGMKWVPEMKVWVHEYELKV